MSAVIESSKHFDIAEQLSPDAVVTFHNVEWETAGVLAEFLNRLGDQGELEAILAFDEWLKARTN